MFLQPSPLKISLQAVVKRQQPCVHTQTHPSTRTRGSLRGRYSSTSVPQPPCFSRLSLWGSCCWEGDVSGRGRTQRKSDERAEALLESSHLAKLSKGRGCYSYLLRAHICSGNCIATIQNSSPLVLLLCQSTHTSIPIRRAGQLCSSSLSEAPWGGRDVWVGAPSGIWECEANATLPLSLLVCSPFFALGVWVAGVTAEGVKRGEAMTLVPRLQGPLDVWEGTTSNKN